MLRSQTVSAYIKSPTIKVNFSKARDQVIAKLKCLDSEIRVALTDIWFENDYSTLRALHLG